MKSSIQQITLASLLSFSLLSSAPSFAGNQLSEASGLSVALTASAVVIAPSLVLEQGSQLTIKAVKQTAKGSRYVLQRASDGAQMSFELASEATTASAHMAGQAIEVSKISTGVLLVASGKVLAFIPNEIGKKLLHSEKVSS